MSIESACGRDKDDAAQSPTRPERNNKFSAHSPHMIRKVLITALYHCFLRKGKTRLVHERSLSASGGSFDPMNRISGIRSEQLVMEAT